MIRVKPKTKKKRKVVKETVEGDLVLLDYMKAHKAKNCRNKKKDLQL